VGRKVPVRTSPDSVTDRAAELFRLARFKEAGEIIDAAEAAGVFSSRAALLRARLFLVADFAGALVYLSERAALLAHGRARGESALLQGAAYSRLGDHSSAAARFKAALELCAGDEALIAEVRYQQAASAWIQRRLDAAERILARVDARAEPVPVRVQRLVLEGAIAASRGDMARQGGLLLEALRCVREQAEPNVFQWAFVVSQISYLARELHSPSLREAVYAELPSIPWTQDISGRHFTTVRAVGWCHALEGDYFNAFRRLKEASLIAPSPAWRVMSLCDRSYLARCLGETRWAEQERNDARELAATVEWAALAGEERFALCLLAELFAEFDGPLALAQIAQYKKAGTHFTATLASADDRRVAALESYSLGVVQRALGDTAEAVRLIRRSYEIYSSVGYRWRAGRAAKALAELTGEAAWAERAAAELAVYPRSWLVAPDARPSAPSLPGRDSLTVSQQAVYEHLVRGLSTKDIALALGRSEFTVRNHVKAIFKALNVKSRASLIARATGTQGA
jgi:DNA-binding NarL/FixJ family response regulator